MIQARGAQHLAGIRHADLQGRIALEHGHHQTDVPELTAVHAGHPQIDDGPLLRRRWTVLLPYGDALLQRIDAVAHDLGRLLVPHGQSALHQHRRVHRHVAAALVDGAAEAQQLDGRRLVLHHHIGHQRIVLGGPCPAGGHDARHGDVLPVGEPHRPVLAGKIVHDLVDRHCPSPLGRGPPVRHGMAGEIQPRGLLLHMHPLGGGVLRDVRQVDPGRLVLLTGGATEHIQLSLHVLPPCAADGVQHRFIHRDELGPPVPEAVEGAAADEVLHRTLVHIAAVVHPLAEVLE